MVNSVSCTLSKEDLQIIKDALFAYGHAKKRVNAASEEETKIFALAMYISYKLEVVSSVD